ncbi:hypothetical protein P7K49_022065 [Saguinus oedipus]|uniref:Uncharacterized protein n=1 Tax=Saguinus oedipus TaxID=9490 RepID=A0ABQ9UWU7_SAGOE|nr:hypothetical protein P7K49_022065 [Saguinus oedipus]
MHPGSVRFQECDSQTAHICYTMLQGTQPALLPSPLTSQVQEVEISSDSNTVQEDPAPVEVVHTCDHTLRQQRQILT